MYKPNLSKEQALQKLKHYCAYQERCHQEVKEKLFSLGVRMKEHDEIIAALIEENYLNEERFAIAFAGGKFRIKKWGRTRIRYELKQRQVSEYSIKKALKQITEEEYFDTLMALATARYEEMKGEQYLVRRKKTTDFLLQKGYEADRVMAVLRELTGAS